MRGEPVFASMVSNTLLNKLPINLARLEWPVWTNYQRDGVTRWEM